MSIKIKPQVLNIKNDDGTYSQVAGIGADEPTIDSDELNEMLDDIFGSADDGGDDTPEEPEKESVLISTYNGSEAPYINLGALNISAKNLTIDVKFACSELNANEVRGIYGCEQHDGRDRYELYIDNRSSKYRVMRAEYSGTTEQIRYLDNDYKNTSIELLTRKGFMYYGDNVTSYNVPELTLTYPFILFGCYNNAQSKVVHLNGSVKIYFFKIYNNDTLIADYIPVLDDDGVACMFDKVSNTYKYSSNSATFTYQEEEV